MKKTLIVSGIVVVVVILALIIFNSLTKREDKSLMFAEVVKEPFEIIVTTTGELQAETSTEIKGPEGLGSRNMRFREILIQDLVPEGTVVEKGDYVATLDRSDADNTLKDEFDQLETRENEYAMKKLDTTITLGNLRDDLMNLKFNMEEAEITLEQSKYEPPTTQRQNRINLDKAQRAYIQAQKNYELKEQQAKADIRESFMILQKQREKVDEMEKVLNQFRIVAPSPGMVIYKREWGGEKRKVGSGISPWDPVVATLPDLSKMISKTYVNEIDISKVEKGQQVRITVDAFPDRKYTGTVNEVANIGEQLPNTDAKVFEVVIRVDGSDEILRPSMTTGNQIVTKIVKDALSIPLECVHATVDSIPFVYMKNHTRQVVVLGESNENRVVVEQGLAEGDILYLNTPEESESYKLVGEELMEVIKEKARERERAIRESSQSKESGQGSRMSPEMMERFQNMSDEERQKAMQQMRQQGGRQGGGTRAASPAGSGEQN
ncbi:MAG: efflux RND transporter periplasmic adaptor subunit [Marinilabiliaceae bacterium]|jgi:multidrug efflux pump subunit AcrA (membrane-fusion protein)|nr:efflux RND transporter periplasmic adaptor subunit [Marinilabiliaceae bacterium]